MSGENQGPDMFFAGGECLSRFGVWIRRTDMDLEAATREDFTRASEAEAIDRASILRTWGLDTARAEWLNEVDLAATRNLMESSNLLAAPGWTNSGLLSVTKLDDPRERFRLVEVVGGSIHGAIVDIAGVPDTLQVFASAVFENHGTRSLCYIQSTNKSAGVSETWFDLTGDGAVLNDFHISSSIQKIGPVSYRCVVEFAPGVGSGDTSIRYAIAVQNGSLSYTGDGVSGLIVGSTQVESVRQSTFQSKPRDLDRKFPSLLLEKSVQNGWTRSEEFDDAAWTKQNSSISPNDRPAPDGTSTADFLREDGSNSNHRIVRDFPGISDNNFISWSVFARQSSRQWIFLSTTRKDGTTAETWFDLRNGVMGGSGNHVAQQMVRYGDEWYRCQVSEQVLSGGTTPFGTIQLALSDGGQAYQGDGVQGLHIWGGQSEANLRPTSSYIPTAATLQTRAGSVFSQDWLRRPVPMTMYCKFTEAGTIDIQDGILVSIANGVGTFFQLKSQPGLYRTRHTANGLNSIATAQTAPAVGELVEVLGTLDEFGRVTCTVQIPVRESEPVTQVAGTDTEGLGDNWDDPFIYINSRKGQTLAGYGRFLAVKVHSGFRSLDFMRAL